MVFGLWRIQGSYTRRGFLHGGKGVRMAVILGIHAMNVCHARQSRLVLGWAGNRPGTRGRLAGRKTSWVGLLGV